MQIKIQCPCGKRLSVDASHAGKQGKCPRCGKIIAILDQGEEHSPRKEYMGRQSQAENAEDAPEKETEAKPQRKQYFCPECNAAWWDTDIESGLAIRHNGGLVYCPSHLPATHWSPSSSVGSTNPHLTTCRHCNKEASKTADKCPHCGAASPGMSNEAYGTIVLIACLVGLFVYFSLSRSCDDFRSGVNKTNDSLQKANRDLQEFQRKAEKEYQGSLEEYERKYGHKYGE